MNINDNNPAMTMKDVIELGMRSDFLRDDELSEKEREQLGSFAWWIADFQLYRCMTMLRNMAAMHPEHAQILDRCVDEVEKLLEVVE